MKDYKEKVLNELERLSNEFHSVMLRRAALNAGVKHLKTQEALEVLNAFKTRRPDFKIYRLDDNPNTSVFCSAFVSDNETPPVAEEACC